MLSLSPTDFAALAWFVIAWVIYWWFLDFSPRRGTSLNTTMDGYRYLWMKEMSRRENRIVDTQIMTALKSGTSFFASTSLLAVGGCLTLLGATDKIIDIFSSLPLSVRPTRGEWEFKVFGLTVIFVYAFFKFSWSYRLFNYCSILIGATPDGEIHPREAQDFARRAARMNILAGRHFNRGQRAIFFALGYLGWFAGPLVFAVSTTGVLMVLMRRQFHSSEHDAVVEGLPDLETLVPKAAAVQEPASDATAIPPKAPKQP